MKDGCALAEEVLGVQAGVAIELKHVAMELIGSGFRYRVQNGPAISSVFRVDGVGDQVYFSNCIGARNNLRAVERKIVRIRSIHEIAVGLASSTVAALVGGKPVVH